MRKKYIIAASILIFTIGTILLYLSPDATSQVRRFSSEGQKMEMTHDRSLFSVQNTGLKSLKIKSKNSGSSKNIALNNSNTSLNGFDITNTNINNFNLSDTEYKTQNIKMNNSFMEHVDIDTSTHSLSDTNSGFKNTGVNSDNFSNSNYNNKNASLRNNYMPYTKIDVADNQVSSTNTGIRNNSGYGSQNSGNSFNNSSANTYGGSNQAGNNPMNSRYGQSGNNPIYNKNANDYPYNKGNSADNQNYEDDYSKYRYEDVDWNVWKSNFLNRILDDCDYIPSLNNYPTGTWFWVSFDVSNTGEINNIIVFSTDVSTQDKQKLSNMIKSYAHSPITVFPRKSKRKSANVRFVMTLDTMERRSRPEDFHDRERVMVRE